MTVGFMDYDEESTPQDYVMADMLFNIAAANGDDEVKGNRDIVAKEMTSGKILEAQQLAKEWMEKY